MHEVLSQSLEPVLRDLRRSGAPEPEVRDDDWTDDPNSVSAMLWSPDGSGTGIYVDLRAPEPERVAAIADQVQEWAIEELWGNPGTNWPHCPHHPGGHPMTASVVDETALWVCPADGTPFSPVGLLA